MIRGRITSADEAILDLAIFGPSGTHRTLEVILDTGFNGYLTLPPAIVAELGLMYHSMTVATLADDIAEPMRRFMGEVVWDGRPKDIVVLEADGAALLGMAMLRGYRVTFDVLIDGRLTVETISEST